MDLVQDLLDFRLCAQYNPLAESDVEQEVADPSRTTNYQGNIPLGPSETPLGTPPRPQPANKHPEHPLPDVRDPAEPFPPAATKTKDAFKVSWDLKRKEYTGQDRPHRPGMAAKVTEAAQETA